jgi:two-component system chemotaxis response regulator CheB
MGSDGRDGMKAIKSSGGRCIAQDESSLIFGMPKEVIDAGYADKVLPVDGIVDAMMESNN